MRYLLSALVLTVVFYTIVKFLDGLYDDAEQFKFELKGERLKASVNFVHRSWSSMGRPNRMRLAFQLAPDRSERLLVLVNDRGWPINIASEDREVNCSDLWRYLADDLSKKEGKSKGKIDIVTQEDACLFRRVTAEGEIRTFTYNFEQGTINGPN